RSAPVQDPDGAFGYGEGSDVAVRVADPTTRGSRVALVAAAAVMALGLGVGGYALGTQTVEGGDGTAAPSVTDEAETDPVADDPDGDGPDADGPDAEDPASAQGSLPDLLREEVSPAGSGAASESMASGGYAMGGASESDMGYGWFGGGGPVLLQAGPGLSEERGTAEVRAQRAPDIDPAEFLTTWAASLGIDAEPLAPEPRYAYIESDGTYLSAYGNASSFGFDFSDSSIDPYCAENAQMMETEMATEDVAASTSMPGPWPEPADCVELGAAPSHADAIVQAQEFLALTGVDVTKYEFQADSYGTASVDVSAQDTTQDTTGDTARDMGMGMGPQLYLTVTAAGIANAGGQIGEYHSLGDYPVISAVEAVERTRDSRFSSPGMLQVPEADEGNAGIWADMDEQMMEQQGTPTVIGSGDPVPFPVTEATVVEATLTTGLYMTMDGSQLSVPAYVLVDEQGRHHTMIALTDEALDFTP
ncbi:MAG: hypothetical protein M3424_05405, partial [Actinomycetota bacterium]|nr:hypothetical protein [Actinomycetota bacterium]